MRAIDTTGNADPTPATRVWTVVDLSAPDTSIDLGPDSETPFTSAIFEFSGAEPDGTPVFQFECSLDLADFANCSSPREVTGLAVGAHVFEVRARDTSGVVDTTPERYEWLILGPTGGTPPDTSIATAPPAVSGPDVIFAFQSSLVVEEFECAVDGESFASCGSVLELVGLVSGPHSIEVRALDLLGNVDPTPASFSWEVVGEPETTILSGPSDPSGSTTATFTFTSDQPGATFRCSLDGTAFIACTSPYVAGGLAPDAHTFEVQASNEFRYLDGTAVVDQTPVIAEWIVQDLVPPDTTLVDVTVLGPTDLVQPDSVRFTFTGSDNGTLLIDLAFECSVDAGPYEGCESPHHIPLADLGGGEHEVLIRAVDELGNVDPTPAQYVVTVEGEPETTIVSGPAPEVDSTEASFTFTSDTPGTTFQCSLDLAAFTACSSSTTFTDVPFGAHSLWVRAVAPGGGTDLTPAEHAWDSGDLTPPVVAIESGPEPTTLDTTATFAISVDDPSALIQCSLDGAPLAFCSSPVVFADLTAGAHTLEVTATKLNLLAEVVPAVWEWTVGDEIAPETIIESRPLSEVGLGSPSVFTFSSNELGVTFECAVDPAVVLVFEPCAGPPDNTVSFGGLAAGTHLMLVRAVDASSNVDPTPEPASWTIVGPSSTSVDSMPPALTPSSEATFTFSADQEGSAFSCALDGSALVACASPVTYTGLGVGQHTFTVTSTNVFGLVDPTPSIFTWAITPPAPNTPVGTNVTVDLVAGPTGASVTFAGVTVAGATSVLTLVSPPPLGASYLLAGSQYYDVSTTATVVTPITICLDFTPGSVAEEVTLLHFEGGAWVDVTSSVDLVNGEVCGQTSGLSPFAIATAVVLDTTILAAPEPSTVNTSAEFVFSSNVAGSTFECSLDGGSFSSCAGVWTMTSLAVGTHTLLVRAKDVAGTVDASPAVHLWQVTPLPDTIIVSSPDESTESTDAVFAFTSTAPAARFECAIDEAADAALFTSCESPLSVTGLIVGEHDILVRSIDTAGHVDPTPSEFTWIVGTVPPAVTVVSGPSATTQDTTATFVLSATGPVSAFACSFDGGSFTTCVSPLVISGVPVGNHTLEVHALVTEPLSEPPVTSYTWTVVPAVPPPDTTIDIGADPVVGAGEDALATVGFAFSSDVVNATFECSVDLAPYGPCVSPTVLDDVGLGTHLLRVRAVNAFGVADATPAEDTFTVVPSPDTTVLTGPASEVDSASAEFTFRASLPGSTFECALDLGPFGPCPSPYTLNGLTDGQHELSARAVSAHLIVDGSPVTWGWTVRLVPDTSVLAGPTSPTTATTALFTFSSDEAGVAFECALDGAAFSPDSCTPTGFGTHVVTGFGPGAHTLLVRSVDGDGNVDPTPASHTWTVVTLPQTTVDSGPDPVTTSTSASFTFSSGAAGSTFECSINGGLPVACTSPYGFTGLALGQHVFTVRATDPNGNVDPTPASVSWSIELPPDTTPPETAIESGPASSTPSTSASFTLTASELGATFECALDSGVFVACPANPTLSDLTPGSHLMRARAVDPVGNTDTTPATYEWTITPVDATPPDTTIDSGPTGPTATTSAAFTFSSSEVGSTFECVLDGGTLASCTSPVPFTDLQPGPHQFSVRAIDPVGNVDPVSASRQWEVLDTTAPSTQIVTGPTGTVSGPATFGLAGSDNVTPTPGLTYQCRIDSSAVAAWVSCSNPVTFSDLSAGAHTLEVRAVDAAGNFDPTPEVRSWTVFIADTSAPETTIGTAPLDGTSTVADISFSATESGSTFACSLDGASFATCTSPTHLTGLIVGGHTFQVAATDAVGNVDGSPATASWTVAAPPPDCGVTTTYAADADAWLDQGSPSSNLGTDSTLKVMSKGPSNNLRALLDFAVPATPPTGCVVQSATLRLYQTGGASGRTIEVRRVTTAWTEGAVNWSVQPSVSDSPATALSGSTTGYVEWNVTTQLHSMYSVAGLHGFQVRDQTENQDAEFLLNSREKSENRPQLVVTFAPVTPDTTAPQTVIDSGPGTTTAASATIGFSADEGGSTFLCGLDGAPLASCVSPTAYSGLAVGTHTFAVQAVDAAGNVDPSPAMHVWTIEVGPPADTTAPETAINSGPPASTSATTATLTFSSNETASLSCSLDGAPFGACSSPLTLSGLAVGVHTFSVRATDGAGNQDTTPATTTWSVTAACAGGSVTLNSVADSWILQSSASNNFATDSVLKVTAKSGANSRALVRFTLPTIPAGCQVTGANLRLYAASAVNGRTLQALRITSAWTETGVTWQNQPTTAGTAATVGSGSGWRQWNVLTQIQTMYTSGNNGFLIRDATESGGGSEQQLHSKEKAPDRPPQLVITFG